MEKREYKGRYTDLRGAVWKGRNREADFERYFAEQEVRLTEILKRFDSCPDHPDIYFRRGQPCPICIASKVF